MQLLVAAVCDQLSFHIVQEFSQEGVCLWFGSTENIMFSVEDCLCCFILALSLCSTCLLQKLASVSPDLPKLIELLTVHQPKENEILLFGGLEASDACQTHSHPPSQVESAVTSLGPCNQFSAFWIHRPAVQGRVCKLFLTLVQKSS